MSVIKLIGEDFFKRVEREAIAAVGVSLVRNNKVVSGETLRSVRAESSVSGETYTMQVFAGEGAPFITSDKPADTGYPMDFKGFRTGRDGKRVKVFELKPKLERWKRLKRFGGSDFMLARSVAENEREAVDLTPDAVAYLTRNASPLIAERVARLLARDFKNNYDGKS